MSLHGLRSVTIGVPNLEETAAYYAEFGLAPEADGWFSTLDAGRQLRLVSAPTRRLIELRVGVDDADDLARVAARLARLGVLADLRGASLEATEPVTGVRVGLDVAPRTRQDPAGNFSEYYSDMDCILDDQLWTPEDLEGARGLFAWGPPPPPSFMHPEDLAAMMTGAHWAR